MERAPLAYRAVIQVLFVLNQADAKAAAPNLCKILAKEPLILAFIKLEEEIKYLELSAKLKEMVAVGHIFLIDREVLLIFNLRIGNNLGSTGLVN